MATGFGIDRNNVRIVSPFVGGAFGCKAMIWPHQVLAAMAAKVANRPVKLVLTRQQMFTLCGHRPRCVQKVRLAAAKDGKLLAIQHDTAGTGSKLSQFSEAAGAGVSRIAYACPNVSVTHKLTPCNLSPPTFMRAPGETPGTFALESAMDELAYALKIDPLELRRINWAEKNPASGKPWSSNFLKKCYEMGAEKFGWKARKLEPRATKDGDLLVGWGVATASFPGNRSGASARVRLLPDGRVIASSATHDMGTGSYTIFAQVAADALGVPIESVTFELGDSSLPPATMSAGSNTAATVGQAVLDAGRALKKKLIEAAVADAKSPLNGLKAEDVDIVAGRIASKADATKAEALAEFVKRSGKDSIEADASAAPNREQRAQYAFNSFGAHFCEVKVDELIGRVRVTRFISVMDIGRVMNHKTARSQVIGGAVMGLGMALMEHTVLDPRTGYPITSNFADYAIPVNADIQQMEAYFTDEPDPYINELGCRGVGEIGITGVAAAVANAVFHATGKRVRELPITPDKLL
jgi:xanthine dehydrogenase YagR molybdenum-binding subunit